jgi:stage V sporulation protein AC
MINKRDYKNYTKNNAPKSRVVRNSFFAFLTGGAICTLGELIKKILVPYINDEKTLSSTVSISLIFIACLATALGFYDSIAKHAGAGTLVPITGFANAMISPALDNKAEGWIMGVGAKMFTIAGPVIVYGTIASVIYGIIYWVRTLL